MNSLELYQQYYKNRNFERLALFQRISEKYGSRNVLYPGSFVHITPSFVFPRAVYVDSDKRAAKFFRDRVIYNFIDQQKQYQEEAQFVFHQADFSQGFNEREESFDMLLSQYAGFISESCKKYLKTGGILVVNNSHGDASLASSDRDYEFIAYSKG